MHGISSARVDTQQVCNVLETETHSLVVGVAHLYRRLLCNILRQVSAVRELTRLINGRVRMVVEGL